MIFNNNIAVGFQCAVCGSIERQRIDIFKLSGQKEAAVQCGRCGKSEVRFVRRSGKITVRIACAGCGSIHPIEIKLGDFVSESPKMYACPACGETVFCTGEDDKVGNLQMTLFEENDLGRMYSEADRYGAGNDMLEVFDHLKDLAMRGRMYCECGEYEIEAELLGNTLRFVCPTCGAAFDIKLTDGGAIKDFKDKREIILKR